jgi:hypothetical protein
VKSGPRAVRNLGIDQDSDGLLQQGAHEHKVGNVDSYRAGETTAAHRWSLTLGRKNKTPVAS